MKLLEKLRVRPAPRPLAVQQGPSLRHFEITGVDELGPTLAFRRDPASTIMAVLFGLLGVFIIVSLWVGTFAKQETMRGSVTASSGTFRATATTEGIVSKVWVAQGQRVKAGQRLVTITPPQLATDGNALTKTDLETLSAQRRNLLAEIERMGALLASEDGDRAQFDADHRSTLAALKDQERRLVSTIAGQRTVAEKFQRYLSRGYATREQAQAQERTLLDYVRQLGETRIQITTLSTSSTERRRTIDQTTAQTANTRAELSSQVHDLDSRLERLKSAVATDILAPIDGEVATLNVREGSVTEIGQVVSALADPDAGFVVSLEAPSSTIGLVEIGQRVVLKYDAFPYKTFGVQYGKVVSVGEAPLLLPKVLDPGSTDNPRKIAQSTFLIEVEPEKKTIAAYGIERPILIGSTLSADVIVERRRLIDWVLDPILAMRGRL